MKSKILGLFFLILFISTKTNGQTLTETDLIGTWKVIEVHNLSDKMPKEEIATMEKLKKAFLKAKFIFKADKKFSFDIGFPDMKIANGHWKINKTNGTITIQEWKDKDSNKSVLMEILTKKNETQVKFLISETFFGLEMQKE